MFLYFLLFLPSHASLVISCFSCHLMLLLSSHAFLVMSCPSCHFMFLFLSNAYLVISYHSYHFILILCFWTVAFGHQNTHINEKAVRHTYTYSQAHSNSWNDSFKALGGAQSFHCKNTKDISVQIKMI